MKNVKNIDPKVTKKSFSPPNSLIHFKMSVLLLNENIAQIFSLENGV